MREVEQGQQFIERFSQCFTDRTFLRTTRSKEKADPRLSLMIRFLEATSCRVSEMLGAEVGKARRGARITCLEIAGKKGKARDLRLPTPLYDAIRELSARTIGKEVTVHLIRHHRGTLLSEKFGISKAASGLGHSSIATTKMFYDHSKLSDVEYLQSIGSVSAIPSAPRRI